MTSPDSRQYPKLRSVETSPVLRGGQHFLAVRDPLQLADQALLVPESLVPALSLIDGTRDASGVSAALAVRFGKSAPLGDIEGLIKALDEALLLENEKAAQAEQDALTEYRRAPFRKPTLAGVSYPEAVDELRDLLDGFLERAECRSTPPAIRGLISPHIDYDRGGPVYAQVWEAARERARQVDLAIIFGTDHYGRGERWTLTRQHYATPYGVLPTAAGIVDSAARTIGEKEAFASELYHLGEHSIELAAVWLHHMRGGEPCQIVPILCGSFARFFQDLTRPDEDPALNNLVAALRSSTKDRQAMVIAAGDLSHVGPAFGGSPLDLIGRARLGAADDELIHLICAGDTEGFFAAIQRVEDRNNVCGAAPIYLTMRMLSPVKGECVAYDRCPADLEGASMVSICGLTFYEPSAKGA